MGLAMFVQSGYVTAPTAAYATVTNAGQDTFSVQNFYQGSQASLLEVWADIDTAGSIRLRSPNFHDDVNGIQAQVASNRPVPVLGQHSQQVLQANDTITAELLDNGAGSPSGLTTLNWYSNLPGGAARLYRWADVKPLIVNLMTCVVSITAAGTAGTYVGATPMNSLQDLFKATTDYALLGYETSVQYQTVGVTSTDTANRRVGGPGVVPDIYDTRDWFVQVADRSGLPAIPVINNQNMNGTIVDVIDTEGNGNGLISFQFAQLSSVLASPVSV